MAREYVGSSGTPPSVFNMFDRNGDGIVTVDEIQNFQSFNNGNQDPLAGFLAFVGDEMKLGSLEETITVSGVSPVVDTQNVRSQNVLSRTVLVNCLFSPSKVLVVTLRSGSTWVTTFPLAS